MTVPDATKHSMNLEGVRVLFVDDSPDSLMLMRILAESKGAQVWTASSVNEALRAVQEQRPDVIVSDISMPQQDGYDLISQLRSLSNTHLAMTPTIAVTGYVRAEDKDRALRAGFDAHITKPVTASHLISMIRYQATRSDSPAAPHRTPRL